MVEPNSEEQAFDSDLCGDSDAEDEFLYTSSAESSRPGSFRADGSSSKRARTSLFPESEQQPVSNEQEVSDVAIPLLYDSSSEESEGEDENIEWRKFPSRPTRFKSSSFEEA